MFYMTKKQFKYIIASLILPGHSCAYVCVIFLHFLQFRCHSLSGVPDCTQYSSSLTIT